MSSLVELGWHMQLATTSAGLYHCDTNTLVCASLMLGRYYVTEHDLLCLLQRKTCESEEAANAAHPGGSEKSLFHNRFDINNILPLVDVT